jgi:hypothetical protein
MVKELPMRHASTRLWITAFLIFFFFGLPSFAGDDSAPRAKSAQKKAPAPITKPDLDGFDDFMAQVLKDWKVPGVAVGVVRMAR